MKPENYPNWLKNKLAKYTSKVDDETFLSYLPFVIDDHLHKSWIKTKCPLFIWRTISLSMQYDLELSQWLKKYISEYSENIMKINQEDIEKDRKAVFEVLKRSAKGEGVNPISSYARWQTREKAWRFVEYYMEYYEEAHPKTNLAEAYFEVSKIITLEEVSLGEVSIKKDHENYREFILKGDNEFPNHS